MTRMRLQRWLKWLGVFCLGVLLGGYLFSASQPRSFLAVHRCQARCWQPSELAGLLASVGILKLGAVLPGIGLETDLTIAVMSPLPQVPVHYLIFPKRDIKDIADLTAEDQAYWRDAFAVIGALVRERGLTRYEVRTNGPDLQQLRYLHFHLLGYPPAPR